MGKEIYKEMVKDWKELFYSTFFSVQKYKDGLIGKTNVYYANGFHQTLNLAKQQANKDNDSFSSKCLSEYLDKMLYYLTKYKLDEVIVTLEEKKQDPNKKQKLAPLQIEEMRGFSNYARLKCGEYRIICMKSNDWSKLLFFGVFHRREGYKKALGMLRHAIEQEGILLDLEPLNFEQIQKLLKEALDADSNIQPNRF